MNATFFHAIDKPHVGDTIERVADFLSKVSCTIDFPPESSVFAKRLMSAPMALLALSTAIPDRNDSIDGLPIRSVHTALTLQSGLLATLSASVGDEGRCGAHLVKCQLAEVCACVRDIQTQS